MKTRGWLAAVLCTMIVLIIMTRIAVMMESPMTMTAILQTLIVCLITFSALFWVLIHD